jgi:hypothetical protein
MMFCLREFPIKIVGGRGEQKKVAAKPENWYKININKILMIYFSTMIFSLQQNFIKKYKILSIFASFLPRGHQRNPGVQLAGMDTNQKICFTQVCFQTNFGIWLNG